METKKQNNKVALITGVTSGIGRQLTYLFAQDGYSLVLVARNKQKLNTLPTHLTRLLLPSMLERGKGKVMFVGSTGSFVPAAYDAIYCATKAYILSFAEGLSQELYGTGITVTCLCPGATQTEFAPKAGMTQTRLFSIGVMDAKVVAQTGYRALMDGKSVVIAGLFNKMQIQAMKFTPRCIAAPLTRYIMSKQ